MSTITRHPLYQKADAIKRALALNGFTFYDNGESKELLETASSFELFHEPSEISAKQILTGDGSYALRTRLLPVHLSSIGKVLPVKAAVSGRIFDGSDDQYPQRLRIEGVIADEGMTLTDLGVLWNKVAVGLYGVGTSASLEPAGRDTMKIAVNAGGEQKCLGYIGSAAWIARALLGLEDKSVSVWVFTIDVDDLAAADLCLGSRTCLYDNTLGFIASAEDNTPAFGDSFAVKAADVMRSLGYTEFIGDKFYTSDAYVRMNMIQESWDTNNQGVTLAEPLGNYDNPLTELKERDGLPTVLAPALEQAMHDNFASGNGSAKLFEIGHIFKPGKEGGEPWEVLSLSFGAYAPDLDLKTFLGDVTACLRKLGINNSFFIPTTMAIAYRQDQCMVILDEKMKYLDGNCGHISPIALKNFGVESEAFMAQFELPTLEWKADQEYGFIPYELR